MPTLGMVSVKCAANDVQRAVRHLQKKDPQLRGTEVEYNAPLVLSEETQASEATAIPSVMSTKVQGLLPCASCSGKGVNLYVVDTGVRGSHAEFQHQDPTQQGTRVQAAFSAYPTLPADSDCLGHGTNVASLAGGNSLGTSTDVNIHSVRIYGCQRSARASNLLAGLDWVVANAKLPAVVLLAVVGPPSKGVEVAMRKLKARGVVVVAAAGNQGRDACGYTPNDVDTVLTVGITATPTSNSGPCVDVTVPYACSRGAGHVSDTGTFTRCGTSTAAPHVAGLVAHLLQRDPEAMPAAVAQEIVRAARDGVAGLGTAERLVGGGDIGGGQLGLGGFGGLGVGGGPQGGRADGDSGMLVETGQKQQQNAQRAFGCGENSVSSNCKEQKEQQKQQQDPEVLVLLDSSDMKPLSIPMRKAEVQKETGSERKNDGSTGKGVRAAKQKVDSVSKEGGNTQQEGGPTERKGGTTGEMGGSTPQTAESTKLAADLINAHAQGLLPYPQTKKPNQPKPSSLQDKLEGIEAAGLNAIQREEGGGANRRARRLMGVDPRDWRLARRQIERKGSWQEYRVSGGMRGEGKQWSEGSRRVGNVPWWDDGSTDAAIGGGRYDGAGFGGVDVGRVWKGLVLWKRKVIQREQ